MKWNIPAKTGLAVTMKGLSKDNGKVSQSSSVPPQEDGLIREVFSSHQIEGEHCSLILKRCHNITITLAHIRILEYDRSVGNIILRRVTFVYVAFV